MKTTTTLVPLPLVPSAPGPFGLGARLGRLPRSMLRRLDPELRARAQTHAHNPEPQRLLPSAVLTHRATHHPAGPIPRPFAPETLP